MRQSVTVMTVFLMAYNAGLCFRVEKSLAIGVLTLSKGLWLQTAISEQFLLLLILPFIFSSLAKSMINRPTALDKLLSTNRHQTPRPLSILYPTQKVILGASEAQNHMLAIGIQSCC